MPEFNYTQPIDITSVNKAVYAHKNVLVPLDLLAASEVLKHCTGIPGVTNSITLGRVENGTLSHKYSGVFLGKDKLGAVVTRDLKVYPCVAEMADEPERYRRTFVVDVRGGLDPEKHPFGVWLMQFGINLASQDLLNVLFTAKEKVSEDNKLEDAFDGWGAILKAEKDANNISAEKKNMFATGDLNAANIGDQLLKMWQAMPITFRRKNSQMWISYELGDMYDEWLKSEVIQLPDTDQSEVEYLRGTKHRVKLIRTSALPDKSKFVLLTTKENMVYGFDKPSDLKGMKAFSSGNPYLFTAAMKYVFGCQFVSIDPSELCINDQDFAPVIL